MRLEPLEEWSSDKFEEPTALEQALIQEFEALEVADSTGAWSAPGAHERSVRETLEVSKQLRSYLQGDSPAGAPAGRLGSLVARPNWRPLRGPRYHSGEMPREGFHRGWRRIEAAIDAKAAPSPRRPTLPLRRLAGLAFLVAAAFVIWSSLPGLVLGSMPGSPLYEVKRGAEAGQLLLTREPASRAMLHLEFAFRRLEEIQHADEQRALDPGQLTDLQLETFAAWLNIRDVSGEQAGILRGQFSQLALAEEQLLGELSSTATGALRAEIQRLLLLLQTLQQDAGGSPTPDLFPVPTVVPTGTPTAELPSADSTKTRVVLSPDSLPSVIPAGSATLIPLSTITVLPTMPLPLTPLPTTVLSPIIGILIPTAGLSAPTNAPVHTLGPQAPAPAPLPAPKLAPLPAPLPTLKPAPLPKLPTILP